MNQEFVEDFRLLHVKAGYLSALSRDWVCKYVSDHPFDELRSNFYKIESCKKEIDELILYLRPYQIIGEGKKREEKEVKTLINSIYFVSESVMVNNQRLFSCLLFKNQ